MSAIVVVSDTSPIRALHHLGHLALLHDLYGRVLIPAAVQHELLKAKPAIDATSLAFLEVRKPLSAAVPSAAIGLDPGETEAILLAQEIGATLLLIDERAGTRVARAMGIDTVGVSGVLLGGKEGRTHSSSFAPRR